MTTPKKSTGISTPNQKTLPSREDAEFDLALMVARGHKSAWEKLNATKSVHRFSEDMLVFSAIELGQLNSLRRLMTQFVQQQFPARPLCLAVFGPPGSGKSHAVKAVRKAVEAEVVKAEKELDPGAETTRLPMTTINLTQVSDPTSIGAILARVAGEQDEKTVPVIFFDEFDTSRDGASLGWLSWFLAPMHDGEFLHGGAAIRLKRVVYVFAGGTASSMERFANGPLSNEHRAAKLPDFVSRLRAYLDVYGPNSSPREFRRAILLRKALADKAKSNGTTAIQTPDDLLESLLRVGRFRHGARSVSAVVELCDFDQQSGKLEWSHLPEDHLLELHIDRGPLDERRIGGSIAFSGYIVSASSTRGHGPGKYHTHTEALLRAWLDMAQALWTEGATLAYAGNWHQDPTPELMASLISALKNLPVEPSRSAEKRKGPSPRLRSFLSTSGIGDASVEIEKVVSKDDQQKYGMKLSFNDYLPDDERTSIADQIARNSVEMFRQRLDTAEASVARFAIGGSISDHRGRMPGVADEVVISLAMGHPVYIAGGWGGAAHEIGRLLALGGTRSGEIDAAFSGDENMFRSIERKFRPSPWDFLPVTASDGASFLKDHAFGSRGWPDNGLTAAENKALFRSQLSSEVAQLVVTGLRRRFASNE
jgi:SLOG cluster2/ATPase family associated with various cellular activities (AAA)